MRETWIENVSDEAARQRNSEWNSSVVLSLVRESVHGASLRK